MQFLTSLKISFASQKAFSQKLWTRATNLLKAYIKFCLQNFISLLSFWCFWWNSDFLCDAAYKGTQGAKKFEFRKNWWAQVDSNHRPHAYQACALTTWAMSPNKRRSISPSQEMVEMNGIEPMTPCLQSRCSPSWATPPYFYGFAPLWGFPNLKN